MRVIIAGSRIITDYQLVKDAIQEASYVGIVPTKLICGAAKGVDTLGEKYAKENGIPIEYYIPEWLLGKHAGMLRNQKMAENADALIAITAGTNGTKDMINRARKMGLKIYIKEV